MLASCNGPAVQTHCMAAGILRQDRIAGCVCGSCIQQLPPGLFSIASESGAGLLFWDGWSAEQQRCLGGCPASCCLQSGPARPGISVPWLKMQKKHLHGFNKAQREVITGTTGLPALCAQGYDYQVMQLLLREKHCRLLTPSHTGVVWRGVVEVSSLVAFETMICSIPRVYLGISQLKHMDAAYGLTYGASTTGNPESIIKEGRKEDLLIPGSQQG